MYRFLNGFVLIAGASSIRCDGDDKYDVLAAAHEAFAEQQLDPRKEKLRQRAAVLRRALTLASLPADNAEQLAAQASATRSNPFNGQHWASQRSLIDLKQNIKKAIKIQSKKLRENHEHRQKATQEVQGHGEPDVLHDQTSIDGAYDGLKNYLEANAEVLGLR